jgi:Fe-S-cluster containining protein
MPNDIERMKPLGGRVKRLVVEGAMLDVKEDRSGATVCIALKGVIGKACSCSIYTYRPDVCSGFKPGSKGCKSARKTFEEATGRPILGQLSENARS